MQLSFYLSYLFPQVLYRTSSEYNRNIKVVEFCGNLRLIVNGCHQSGGLIKWLWELTFTRLQPHLAGLHPKRVLILGFAGGSVARVITHKWPKVHLTAVEIDPVMISLARRYFALDKILRLNLVNADAFTWLEQNHRHFDLLVVDLFSGSRVPPRLANPGFLDAVHRSLTPKGAVLVNIFGEPDNSQTLADFTRSAKDRFASFHQVKIYDNLFFVLKP